MSSRIFVLAVVAALAGGCGPDKQAHSLLVTITAPDDYIRGAVFSLRATYESDDQLSELVLDERMLESTGSFELQLTARKPSSLREMRAELRHPKYRPASVPVPGNPHEERQVLTIEPDRWTGNEKHTFVYATEEISAAALDHLRWITSDYFARPEALLANEAVQQNYQLLGMLAYGGGKKEGEWEALRQQTIAELGTLKEAIDERSLDPCPEDYEVANLAYPPCGRQEMNVTYYSVNTAEREAEQEEQIRVMQLAFADLVARLGIDRMKARFAGSTLEMWRSSALGCPAEGQSYAEEEIPGYVLLFTVKDQGTHYYHGREGEDPFYCPEDMRKW